MSCQSSDYENYGTVHSIDARTAKAIIRMAPPRRVVMRDQPHTCAPAAVHGAARTLFGYDRLRDVSQILVARHDRLAERRSVGGTIV